MTPNPWFQFSTPGIGMPGMYGQPMQPGAEPGMPPMPGMQSPGLPELSRFAPPVPQDWMSSAMPVRGNMAKNQSPSLMQTIANQMSRGNAYRPISVMSGMPMNPRYQMYAGMNPDGQIGKGGNPAMMGGLMSGMGGQQLPGGAPASLGSCCG